MFTIESKIKRGGVWDEKAKKLVKFEKGIIETNDAKLAELCRELEGFTVTGEADSTGKFDGWDVEQLKAYAVEKNIDIGNASSVNGITAKIKEAEKEG